MYLICPLCGLRSHLNRFKPEELQEIIELIEMRSLGRARGWKDVARYSALDDKELMDRIAIRCHIILEVIGEEPPKPMDTDLDEELRDRIEELQEAADGHEEEMDGILAKVNSALSNVYEEFIYLENAVETLIVEYREAMEEAEDEVVSEVEDDDDPLSELDKELLLAEREEARAEKEGDDGF